MTSGGENKRLAVLIDGDNFPAELADLLFARVAGLGNAVIRRVYGNAPAMNNWRERARQHGIALRESALAKNAADMYLAIDAMDILHRGRVELFCIVSSDGDFTALANRLREDVAVYGFGGIKAAAGFKDACDSFAVLEKLASAKAAPAAKKVAAKSQSPSKAAEPSGQQAADERFRVLLLKAFGQLQGADWYPLSTVLAEVRKLQPQFTAKAFGSSKPITLVRKTDCFDDELRDGTMMVRRRPAGVVLDTFMTRMSRAT